MEKLLTPKVLENMPGSELLADIINAAVLLTKARLDEKQILAKRLKTLKNEAARRLEIAKKVIADQKSNKRQQSVKDSASDNDECYSPPASCPEDEGY